MHLPRSLALRCTAASVLLWLATGPISSALAGQANSEPAQTTASDCNDAAASQRTLLGRWSAELSSASPALPTTAEIELWPHPELSASVRGRMLRSGAQALVAGDVDQGDFTLEESVNGTNISATWIGEVVPGSCGQEIRGTWSQEQPPLTRSFVLRKQASK